MEYIIHTILACFEIDNGTGEAPVLPKSDKIVFFQIGYYTYCLYLLYFGCLTC